MSDIITETPTLVMAPENILSNRLTEKFGSYSEATYKNQMEKWRLLLHELDSGKTTVNDVPIHGYIKHWVGYGTMPDLNNKEKMIEAIQNNPEAAGEIQDFAQWTLINQTDKGINLYPTNKLTVYRGIRGKPNTITSTIDIKDFKILPWDSLTSNKDFAETSANPYSDWGWKEGFLMEIEIPIENIFTYYKAHPAFNPHLPEQEFILNENGVNGARLISIDGRKPTFEEIQKVKKSMPNLEVDIELARGVILY